MSRLTIAHEMGLPGWVERLPFCQSFLVRIVHPLPLDLQNCPLLEQEQQALHLFHADWMVQDCPCACVESFLWALPCSLVGGGEIYYGNCIFILHKVSPLLYISGAKSQRHVNVRHYYLVEI